MTINIALATFEAIVLGCDSLSSAVANVIYPFGDGVVYAEDDDGNILTDKNGMPYISIARSEVKEIATTVIGGVNKIFSIYDDRETCVAALTAGLATIGGVSIAEQAKRYSRKTQAHDHPKFVTTDEVCKDFHAYFRALWENQFKDTLPERRAYLPTIQFIVAGYGSNDEYGKIFKLDISLDTIVEQFPEETHTGLCWAGQSEYVERLLRGVDKNLVFTATREIASAMQEQRERFTSEFSEALAAAGIMLPEGLTIEVSEHAEPTLPWQIASADVDPGNLSTQYAVEFIEMLVNTQSGMQRFARGIPTVGGRTHIGVLKRGEGLVLLNEPQLEHKHTGYSNDY